jgi:hypothetical protein
MKKFTTLFVCLCIIQAGNAQNVGIGTLTPNANLEIKNPLKSIIKISSRGISDTTVLIFSNRNSFNSGTDMLISSNRQEGLRFFSNSDLPANNRDSIMQITAKGNVGIGTINPLEKFHVNGNIRSNGLNILGTNTIELGVGIVGKEVNAGKIGYALFSPLSLDITGAGTPTIPRKIRLWAEGGTTFEGPLNVTNVNSYTGLSNAAVNVNAYTRLGGSASPAIKTKVLYGTLGAFNNGQCYVVLIHGLDAHQILSATVTVDYGNGSFFNENSQGIELFHLYNNNDLTVTSAESILSGKKVQVFITYQDATTWP